MGFGTLKVFCIRFTDYSTDLATRVVLSMLFDHVGHCAVERSFAGNI